jgi:hypothetical protein
MAFSKGKAKTGGRKPGVANKLTTTVKEKVLDVFNELQHDKEANLLTWAKSEPTEFYKIASKLIPTEVSAKVEGKIITVIPPGKKP